MDTRGNGPLRELLAAEYALGTLRGGARRRFERWLRHDDELRAISLAWSERLAPLVDSVGPVVPPVRVWRAIEDRLPGFSARHASASAGWWDRLNLWRGLSGAFALVAALAIAIALRPVPAPPVETLTRTEVVQVETLPTAVATLTDPKSGVPVAVVMASNGGRELIVKVAADIRVDAGQVLQLWSTPNGKDLASLGVLPAAAPGRPLHAKVDRAQLAGAAAIGLSLEPAGGSPQPTHVLGLGALVRVAG